MKKVIFISALAIAAAVSCNKSEIVDTKFNEQISFESYIGRDAMTKASVIDASNVGTVAVYGYYTGASQWNGGMTANLWNPLTLTVATDGVGSIPEGQEKYWTNANDNYTFIAYAPIDELFTPSTSENGPVVSYTVPVEIPSQKDLLYGARVNMQKETPVQLALSHALSRITVKVSENADEFDYTVYGVKISGNFPRTNTLTLNGGVWGTPSATETAAYEIKTYETENVGTADAPVLKPINGIPVPTPVAASEGVTEVKAYDFASRTVTENETTTTKVDNYLMVIPTPGEETAKTDLTLEVVYTTTFDNKESTPMTKTLPISVDFNKGYAYSFDLVFAPNTDNVISFKVTVDPWVDADPVLTTGENGNDNPENWNKETQNGGENGDENTEA